MGCINISIIDDVEQEMTEEFNVTVVVMSLYSSNRCTPVSIRIIDNDGIVVCCHFFMKQEK
jgi:hypothetical protein